MRTVPELEAAQSASRPSRDWANLLFGRTLPALFFGLFIVVYVMGTAQAAARLRQGATADDYLALANRLLRLAFFTMLVVMYGIRLPTKKADRPPPVGPGPFLGPFCIRATSLLPPYPAVPPPAL